MLHLILDQLVSITENYCWLLAKRPNFIMDYSGPYAKELQLACLTVQRATLLTKKLLAAVEKGSLDKSDDSPVTIADFAAQA